MRGSGGEQPPQHKGEDAAVTEVLPLPRRVEPHTGAEPTENESGDYLMPLREGAIGPEHIRAELGDVLVGAAPGRTSAGELTVFKSLGIAIEDLAAAEYVVARARETGAGTEVAF